MTQDNSSPDQRRLPRTQEITDRVIKLVAEQLGLPSADVKLESEFVADLGVDSLDSIELVMAMEDEFRVEIPDEDAEMLATPQDVVTWLVAINRAF